MSCSLYRWTEACDGQPCPGDCDVCDKNMEDDDEQIPRNTDDGQRNPL